MDANCITIHIEFKMWSAFRIVTKILLYLNVDYQETYKSDYLYIHAPFLNAAPAPIKKIVDIIAVEL